MRMRVVLLAAGVVIAGLAIGFFITQYVTRQPAPLTATTTNQSSQGLPVVNVELTTVGAVGPGGRPDDPHPNWVGYLPTTFIHAPANSIIHMTIHQQDSASGLRNEYFGLVRGTIGNSMTINGKTTQAIDPTMAAHTFTIPDLGVSIPLLGVAANAPANAENLVVFDFRVPGPGLYRWQCFVPCGAGTLYGNGGPMQTLGYMAGELVVS